MTRVIGTPGAGAFEQARGSAVRRLEKENIARARAENRRRKSSPTPAAPTRQPTPKSTAPTTTKQTPADITPTARNVLIGVVVLMWFLLYDRGGVIGLIVWTLLAYWAIKKVIEMARPKSSLYDVLHDPVDAYNTNSLTPPPPPTHMAVGVDAHAALAKAHATVDASMKKLKNGADMNTTVFEGDEVLWLYGALGEKRTSDIIGRATLPGNPTLVNDIELLKNGETKANIDHMLLTRDGVITLDTKVWSRLPRLNDYGGNTYTIDPNDKNHGVVSTCIYEASFLPVVPRGLVFVVGGGAARELEKRPGGFVQIVGYSERYDEDKSIKWVPFPVFLVAQKRVVGFLNDNVDGGVSLFNSGATMTEQDIYSSPNMRLSK